MAGIDVPYDTKVLIYETDDTSHDCAWANEKLTTLLGMYKAETLDEAYDICYKLVLEGGAGHSAALYIDPAEEEKITKFGLRMKAGRVIINQPTSFAGIGDLYNFDIAPSLTLGPGAVGHSAYMGNTNYEQLLDIKVLTMRKENMLWLQLPKKVYFKTGCTPVALREMKEVYDFKRAFIITDSTLYQLGACDAIINQLRDSGIETAEFFDIRVDPQIQDAMKGLPKMHEFQPDVIIAVGGGSAIDTAKIMWIMYEHPEEAFLDMATIFLDIRKRIRFFPQMGKKAKLVCIPTTAGTGSECTPFTIISDANTGMKWPLIGYEMMPEMAIIDADNMMKLPPRATQASGYDVLTHAVEAYVSTFATEYTNGMCRDATKMVFDYLPRAYRSAFHDAKPDPVAREKMANASAIAGIAFANAFLGINHSLSHKLGGWFHIPHGTANALLFPFERPRGDQHTPRLRIDDVDGVVFGLVTRQAGMQRGQRTVIGMLPAVIPLLRRREDKHRHADDPGRVVAIRRHTVFQVGAQVDDPVVGAHLPKGGRTGNHHRIAVRTDMRSQVAALSADHGGFQVADGLREPLPFGQQAEDLEQDRRGIPHARHQRASLARAVPDPDPDGIVGGHAYGPRIAGAPAGTRLSSRRQSGVQALDTVAAAWNIQVPYFCSGGVFYWGEQPEQTMTYTFEAGRNILSLARRGSLWDLETVSAPFVRHSHRIQVSHPSISGEVEVVRVRHLTNDEGFIRTHIYF